LYKSVLFLLLLTSSIISQSNTGSNIPVFDLANSSILFLTNWKYHFGDIEDGANPFLNDSSWKHINRATFRKDEKGIHWFRTNIIFYGNLNPNKEMMIWISKLPSAFEIFWDGKLIGSNGVVSYSKTDEVPGNYIYYKRLLSDLTPNAEHCLAIKASNYHGELLIGNNTSFFTMVGYYSDWFGPYSASINRHYFNIGLLFITCIMCFSLFIAVSRNMSFLFLGVFCLIEISFDITFILVNLKLINILQVDYIYMIRNLSYYMEGILVNLFIILKYKIPKKYIHISLVILVTILSGFLYEFQFLNISLHHFILFGYATGLMIYSTFTKKTGSIITLIGVLSLFILNIFNVSIQLFNIMGLTRLPFLMAEVMYIIFISSIIFSTTVQIRKQNREHEKARTLSQRLEMELLKRNIKPHFIMNTLFSIISLIRKEPNKAIKMIHALADEFHIINRISSKRLIPIEEEIELCNKHLKIMEYRRNAEYQFYTQGINSKEQVPPMIFHTLIENGITHSYKIGENGIFKLFFNENGKKIKYIFQNGGSKLKSLKTKNDIESGTGLNYVKARLNESFVNKWDMKYGLNNGFWEVEIEIRK
jgi:sensor histidine kinase YesM